MSTKDKFIIETNRAAGHDFGRLTQLGCLYVAKLLSSSKVIARNRLIVFH